MGNLSNLGFKLSSWGAAANSLVSETAFVLHVVWSYCNQGDWKLGEMASPAYRGLFFISAIAQNCAQFNKEVKNGVDLCRERLFFTRYAQLASADIKRWTT